MFGPCLRFAVVCSGFALAATCFTALVAFLRAPRDFGGCLKWPLTMEPAVLSLVLRITVINQLSLFFMRTFLLTFMWLLGRSYNIIRQSATQFSTHICNAFVCALGLVTNFLLVLFAGRRLARFHSPASSVCVCTGATGENKVGKTGNLSQRRQ